MNYTAETIQRLGKFFPGITKSVPSPQTELIRVEFQTGEFLNNDLSAQFIELAAESSENDYTSILKRDIGTIFIEYYWEQNQVQVFLFTQLPHIL